MTEGLNSCGRGEGDKDEKVDILPIGWWGEVSIQIPLVSTPSRNV